MLCLGRCYCLMVVADVKATLYVYMIRLMLLPVTMADVIANIAS